jgi:uridine kinase
MTMTEAALSRIVRARIDHALVRFTRHADRSISVCTSGAQPATVVRFAELSRVDTSATAVDSAACRFLIGQGPPPRPCCGVRGTVSRRQTGAVDSGIRTFADSARDIKSRPGPVRLVGIDGCGGAGKSTFASRLARALGGAPVVHTDDFASHNNPTEWWPTMLFDVIEPLLRGEPATYCPYDWVTRQRMTAVTVDPAPLLLIEGVGATRAAWRDELAVRVWVDCPRDLRLARGVARDGEQLREFWLDWMRAEDAYVMTEHPYAHADVIVDGATQTPEPESEYVVLPRLTAPR